MFYEPTHSYHPHTRRNGSTSAHKYGDDAGMLIPTLPPCVCGISLLVCLACFGTVCVSQRSIYLVYPSQIIMKPCNQYHAVAYLPEFRHQNKYKRTPSHAAKHRRSHACISDQASEGLDAPIRIKSL